MNVLYTLFIFAIYSSPINRYKYTIILLLLIVLQDENHTKDLLEENYNDEAFNCKNTDIINSINDFKKHESLSYKTLDDQYNESKNYENNNIDTEIYTLIDTIKMFNPDNLNSKLSNINTNNFTKSKFKYSTDNSNNVSNNKDSLSYFKITNNIKHISSNIINNPSIDITNYNKLKFNTIENNDRIFKLPTLLFKCNISDSFKGDIIFSAYIASINGIKNEFVISSNILLLDVNERNKGTLFLDGYLETDIDYSIPLEYKIPLVCNYSNYVVRNPFSISLSVNLEYPIPGDENAFTNLDLKLLKSSFNTNYELADEIYLNDSIFLYKNCSLSVVADYYIEIFKLETFSY